MTFLVILPDNIFTRVSDIGLHLALALLELVAALLLGWIERFRLPWFVATSNVDGQFQKAGFSEDRLVEVHGSIHHLQCCTPCSGEIWENREAVAVDLSSMRARQFPRCRRCAGVARPNILMFGDWGWIPDRTQAQRQRLDHFLETEREKRLLVIELGAGTGVPTIRLLSESLGTGNARVIRVNPREPQIGAPHLSLPVGALEGLEGIDQAL